MTTIPKGWKLRAGRGTAGHAGRLLQGNEPAPASIRMLGRGTRRRPLSTRMAKELREAYTAPPSASAIRDAALEEAMAVADKFIRRLVGPYGQKVAREIAAAIRALRGAEPGDGWHDVSTAPLTGFFMAWSPEFPDLPTVWKAELFHQARKPGTPKHLAANHWTHWRPLPREGERGCVRQVQLLRSRNLQGRKRRGVVATRLGRDARSRCSEISRRHQNRDVLSRLQQR